MWLIWCVSAIVSEELTAYVIKPEKGERIPPKHW